MAQARAQHPQWVGWLRRGPTRPWFAVCGHDSLQHCHEELLRVAEAEGVRRSLDRFITAGATPVERREVMR